MARVTIEDCIKTIPNRFNLTLAATIRARQLSLGGTPMVDADGDKSCVIALDIRAQFAANCCRPVHEQS